MNVLGHNYGFSWNVTDNIHRADAISNTEKEAIYEWFGFVNAFVGNIWITGLVFPFHFV